jgi:hypothetical protein
LKALPLPSDLDLPAHWTAENLNGFVGVVVADSESECVAAAAAAAAAAAGVTCS